jgi:hypothetical protein
MLEIFFHLALLWGGVWFVSWLLAIAGENPDSENQSAHQGKP